GPLKPPSIKRRKWGKCPAATQGPTRSSVAPSRAMTSTFADILTPVVGAQSKTRPYDGAAVLTQLMLGWWFDAAGRLADSPAHKM
ncbi:MAG: hypothetical protein AB1791_23235, partial [Chloroflexota bacterium]